MSLEDHVISILMRHRGRSRAIKVQEIADMVGVVDNGLTNPMLRAMIKEIMKRADIPIASCHEGYFVIRTEGEYQDYIKNLEGRILGIRDRISAVRKAWCG